MKYRRSGARVLLGSILSVVCVVSAPALHAAGAKKSAAGWKVPRTADGKPDLQGNWSNATLTQLERAVEQGDRKVLTAEEARKIEGAAADHVEENAKPTDPKLGIQDLPKDCGYGFSGTNCGYNNFWVDRGTQVIRIYGEPRSSIITEPANGRIPGLTPAAGKEAAARMAAFRKGAGPVDGPEVRSLGERCLTSFGSSAGPPMLPLMYNNTYSIVQTPDTVMILVEMIHDARVVRIGAKHVPGNVKKWYGDSIGHWEGDTLVVETTNFHPMQTFRGLGPDRKVTERFTRVSADQILYQFKVEDPALTQPFAGELPMNATPDLMYEYACHEGNYALPGILAGAREEEKLSGGKSVKQNEADNDKGE
ncbi:hypothetical protein [Steroidobacter cummioxidans]|uniref:hypothetical protein n=1 Tax=Steroidobacter cummioxidans TaxID=1803913 RepID=UPI000E312B0D|nr:hypothetical protein [Steroidobacter cummioxidans]